MTTYVRFVLAALLAVPAVAGAVSPRAVAESLAGTVKDTSGHPLEGVLVIAQRDGGTVLVSVASDASGRYAFPRERLAAGRYHLSVRAAGYSLTGPRPGASAVVPATRSVTRNLVLAPVTSPDVLASQLTSLEWMLSFPGTDAEKSVVVRNMVNCAFCHSLERIARSTHDADAFVDVIRRMSTYETDHSSAERVQLVGPMPPAAGLAWWGRDARLIAEYFARVNLRGRKTWDYSLKTLPRPTGEATRAVVTVFPIPRAASVIHDLDVDAKGRVWYGNTGWDYLGMLDPKTGEFREWPAPNRLPAGPDGSRILGVQDIQVDGDGLVWAAIGGNALAAFDPTSERWHEYPLPVIWKNPFLGPMRPGERGLWVTGLTRAPDGEVRHEHAFRFDLDAKTLGAPVMLFDDKPSPVDPDHSQHLNYCYMMDQDAQGNFLCTVPEASAVARLDPATGKVRLVPTPTPHAYPRRGYRDGQNRFWFGEFWADRIGVIDLATDRITEYPVDSKWISPYYARPDGKGRIWVSSTGSDRLLRLDPATGQVVQYLMPVPYDARKVVVDRSADRTTVWLPNKNRAELVRIELPRD
jgi:streptogramin lyase